MEEDDDDFYGGAARGQNVELADAQDGEAAEAKEGQMDVSEDQNEEEDDEDDVQFTLEKPEGASSQPARPSAKAALSHERTVSTEAKANKAATPMKQEARSGSTAPPQNVKGILTHGGKEGKDFPDTRSKTAPNLDAIPIWPANGKPITELDIDADLAEHSKPWRLPGTDQTDFFNYGFDEYTWTQYCIKQQTMTQTINQQQEADSQMKAMFGGGPGGPMPGGGGGVGAMASMPPGLPDPEQMMQEMMAQGMNPANMDFGQFMQMAQQMGGGPGGPMPGMPNPGQLFQDPQPGGGGYGSGQTSVSPTPGAGQGFQPPQGPQGGNIEGYSAQQLAIMQGQQMGGGGGRGRGRRGRGFY